ncbi:SDR family NAD(P)-dependent oxidoreductase, partial [Reyranella sp.]|uniref:SDR family NAD(P)-dependent oxidoreductase n=1 Tax=Reyranella sp. TaxID=1929291 RepID=UPI002F95DF0D
MKLSGRVALVTGAQQGIGAAIAAALASEGADVSVNWLDDPPAAEAVAARIRAAGRRALLVKADMSKLPEIAAMVGET